MARKMIGKVYKHYVLYRPYWFGIVVFVLLAAYVASETFKSNDLKSAKVTNSLTGTVESSDLVVLRYTSFMLNSSATGYRYYDAISDFEADNPDIRIEVDYIQNVNYMNGLKTRLLGGEKIDVFDVWSPSLFEELRRLEDNVYLDLTEEPFLVNYEQALLEPVTRNGHIYGVPGLMHTSGLLYNKTMFEQLGLSVPQSWDEFIQVCEALKAENIIPIALNSEWWVPQFFFGSLMSNAGADEAWTAQLEQGQLKTNHPIIIESMKKSKEIIEKGFVPKNWEQLKHEQSRDLIRDGKAAMIISGSWELLDLASLNDKQEIDFMVVPGVVRTVPNLNIGSYKVISASSEHPTEAKKFLAYMNGRATQFRLANELMAVPSVKNVILEAPLALRVAELITNEDAMIYWPHILSTESLQLKVIESLNEYLRGASLNDVLANIQEAIDLANKRQWENGGKAS